MKLLVVKRALLPNYQDSKGWTAVHWAAACEEESCVKVFVATRKVNCMIASRQGETPLHLAAKTGNRRVSVKLQRPVYSEIAQSRCTLPFGGTFRHTPLPLISLVHWPSCFAQSQIFHLLAHSSSKVSAGEAVNVPCNQGFSPKQLVGEALMPTLQSASGVSNSYELFEGQGGSASRLIGTDDGSERMPMPAVVDVDPLPPLVFEGHHLSRGAPS